jgi:putative ABC transport system permease protein
MILNYLHIGIRNLFRNKLYSVINIGGLAGGLAVCMTILLYVVHEHSYDRFHRDAQQIFLLGGSEKFGGQQMAVVSMSHVVAPMMQQANPKVESYMRIYGLYNTVDLSLPSNPAVHYRERRNFLFADNNFFRFFSFHLIRGMHRACFQIRIVWCFRNRLQKNTSENRIRLGNRYYLMVIYC